MVTRELELRRIVDSSKFNAITGDDTIGYVIEKAPYPNFIGWSCEDRQQVGAKIPGQTRIPAGRYRLTLNKVETELTLSYRKRYPLWFKFHVMLNDVHGFSGIYIHIGNDDEDSKGCLLLGDLVHNPIIYPVKPLQRSTDAFKRFYEQYYPIIDDINNAVYLTVIDEKF